MLTMLQERGINLHVVVDQPSCLVAKATNGDVIPAPDLDFATGLRTHYMLDLASVIVALSVKPEPGHKVLDMCAAPGGKSLVIAHQLFLSTSGGGYTGTLVSNDRSQDRRERLKTVLEEYLPGSLVNSGMCAVQGHDGTHFGEKEVEVYDRVLVDAPCGSERHVMKNAFSKQRQVLRDEWSAGRSRRNAGLQLDLLISGLRTLKPGGRLVYSTCSISPIENDTVVARALDKMHKRGDAVEVVRDYNDLVKLIGAEETEHGTLALPDKTKGWGPLFWTVLSKAKRGNRD